MQLKEEIRETAISLEPNVSYSAILDILDDAAKVKIKQTTEDYIKHSVFIFLSHQPIAKRRRKKAMRS